MRRKHGRVLGGVAALACAAAAQPQPAADPAPRPAANETAASVFAGLKPGSWHLRMVDGASGTPADICVGDVRQLVQLRHGDAACDRFVAMDEPRMATVSYACHAAGSGRTTLRLQPDGGVHIDSQGIADKAPFAFVAEARRTGDCAASQPSPPGSAAR